jgi:hypothetical protein
VVPAFGSIGSSITNVAPWPGEVTTNARPPWASAIDFTIESPSPVPPLPRVRDGSAR